MSGVPRPSRRFRAIARLLLGLAALLRLRVRTTGLEHVPADAGAVVTWNHHSHFDFVVTAFDLYRVLDRPVRILAMRELWSHRWLGWAPRLADAIPVERASDVGRDRALDAAVAALREGHLVLVAPDARISRTLELGTWRTGAARMAQRAGVVVVPSASWGTHRLSTTGFRARPWRWVGTPVEVAFGPPLRVDPGGSAGTATSELRARTAALLDDVQHRYPDGLPAGAPWVPARLGGAAPPPSPEDGPSVGD